MQSSSFPLFIRVRGIEILRTSPIGDSRKFATSSIAVHQRPCGLVCRRTGGPGDYAPRVPPLASVSSGGVALRPPGWFAAAGEGVAPPRAGRSADEPEDGRRRQPRVVKGLCMSARTETETAPRFPAFVLQGLARRRRSPPPHSM